MAAARTEAGQKAARLAVGAALAGVQTRGRIHYSQDAAGARARMSIVRRGVKGSGVLPAGDLYDDCSSFVTGCYFLAGAPDPNGRGYNGTGWTGSLSEKGRRVELKDARLGDLALYRGHVAIFVGYKNGVAMVVSHGSEAAPVLVPLTYRSDLIELRTYPLS